MCSIFAASNSYNMQRLISNTLSVLSNLPMVRHVFKFKALLVNGGKNTRAVLIILLICTALFTLTLAWLENGPIRTELFSALTIFSLLMFLRLISTDNRVNDN